MKRRINAQAEEDNALRNIFGLKIDFIKKKILGKLYSTNGYKAKIVNIKYESRWTFDRTFSLTVYFAAVPQTVRDLYALTKVERELLGRYEKEIFNEFDYRYFKANEALIAKEQQELHWQMRGCKNHIELITTVGWRYTLEDITSSTFVNNGLSYEKQSLW